MFYKLYLENEPGKLIKRGGLGKHGKSVLINSLFRLTKRNMLEGSPAELIIKLGITKHEFELGMQDLKKNNIIRKYSKNNYMFNPDLLYYGSDVNYFIMKNIWNTQTTPGVRVR